MSLGTVEGECLVGLAAELAWVAGLAPAVEPEPAVGSQALVGPEPSGDSQPGDEVAVAAKPVSVAEPRLGVGKTPADEKALVAGLEPASTDIAPILGWDRTPTQAGSGSLVVVQNPVAARG